MANDLPGRSDASKPAAGARPDEGDELPLPPAPGRAGEGAIDVGGDDLDLVESEERGPAGEVDFGDDDVIEDAAPEPTRPGTGASFEDEPDFDERAAARGPERSAELDVGLDEGIEDPSHRSSDDGGREGTDDDVPIDEGALPPLDAGDDDVPGDDPHDAPAHWVFDVSGPHETVARPTPSDAPPPFDRAPPPPGELLAWAKTASSTIALRLHGGAPFVDRLRGDDGAWERGPLQISVGASALRSARLIATAAGELALLAGGDVATARSPRWTFRLLQAEGALALAFLGDEPGAPLAVVSRTATGLAVDLFDGRGDASRLVAWPSLAAPAGASVTWERDRETLLVTTAAGTFELRRRVAH